MKLTIGLLFLGATLFADVRHVSRANGPSKPSAPIHVHGTVRNESGDPLAGVEIARDLDPLMFEDRSDRTGTFDMNVGEGAHALVFDGAGYCRKRVEAGAGSGTLLVVLEACASIAVRVRDGSGQRIEGLPLHCDRADGRDAGSVYGSLILGVEPGRVRITVDGRPDIRENVTEVGRKDATVTLKTAGRARLGVRVTDIEAQALTPFVRAALVRGEVPAPITEEKWTQLTPQLIWPDDKNNFSGLEGGTYTVLAGATGMPIASTRIVLGKNATKTVTVRFQVPYRELP